MIVRILLLAWQDPCECVGGHTRGRVICREAAPTAVSDRGAANPSVSSENPKSFLTLTLPRCRATVQRWCRAGRSVLRSGIDTQIGGAISPTAPRTSPRNRPATSPAIPQLPAAAPAAAAQALIGNHLARLPPDPPPDRVRSAAGMGLPRKLSPEGDGYGGFITV